MTKKRENRGGRREGSGRKPSANPRDRKVLLAFTADEEATIVEAAELSGELVATFCRVMAYEAAVRLLKRSK